MPGLKSLVCSPYSLNFIRHGVAEEACGRFSRCGEFDGIASCLENNKPIAGIDLLMKD